MKTDGLDLMNDVNNSNSDKEVQQTFCVTQELNFLITMFFLDFSKFDINIYYSVQLFDYNVGGRQVFLLRTFFFLEHAKVEVILKYI